MAFVLTVLTNLKRKIMKKLFFSAVAMMVMVSVSNTFASKSSMNTGMAVPADTTVSAPSDTTLSEPEAGQPAVGEEPATEAPTQAEPEDTAEQKSADTVYMLPSDTTSTDSSALAML